MGNSGSSNLAGTDVKAPVVVYSKTSCPYCVRAKNLLKDQKIDYVAYELNLMTEGYKVAQDLKQTTGLNYVPQIFICGKLIGGFAELAKLHEEGSLIKLTKECTSSPSMIKAR